MESVSLEIVAVLIAVIGVGVALWRAIAARHKEVREDISGVRNEVSTLRDNMAKGNEKLQDRLGRLDGKVEYLKGLVEGLRDRSTAGPPYEIYRPPTADESTGESAGSSKPDL